MSKVYFIGAGPGDPELITLKGYRIIGKADLIIYAGSLVPEDVFSHRKNGSSVIDSSSLTLEEIHRIMKEAVLEGKLVARLHSGDTSIYSAIREQIHFLERDGIPYEIIPGVTAAFALAAKTGVTFTIPQKTQTLIFTRITGRTSVPESEQLEDLAKHGSSLAIYLSGNLAGKVTSSLLKAGLDGDTPVVIGHRVGWSNEKILFTSIADLQREVEKYKITRQTLFLVLPGQKSEMTFSKLYDPNFSHGFRR